MNTESLLKIVDDIYNNKINIEQADVILKFYKLIYKLNKV